MKEILVIVDMDLYLLPATPENRALVQAAQAEFETYSFHQLTARVPAMRKLFKDLESAKRFEPHQGGILKDVDVIIVWSL